MALTPAEEKEYQRLGNQLGFLGNTPAPTEESYGTLGFAGRTAANILPGALEKIVQPAQALLGMTDRSEIPNFFNVRAPQGVTEHVIGGAGELAEYLPALLLTEGMGASALTGLGASATAAKVGGAALGFGLPMANHGAETSLIQGGTGALQTAAMNWGWRGKVAAGLLGGAAGYYEGAKGPTGTPTQGAIFGALNLLGPTVIDPVINRLTGYKPDIGGGRPIEGQPHPTAPVSSALPGGAGVMDDAFQSMNAAQRQAYLDAVAGRSEPPAFIGPRQQPAGFFGDFSVNPGGGLPLDRNPIPPMSGTFEGGARVPRKGVGLFPVPNVSETMGTGAEFAYGRSTDPYDAFAGLQRPPIMSQGEIAGRGELFPEAPLTPREQLLQSQLRGGRTPGGAPELPRLFEPRTRMSETALSGADIYGGATGLYDITQGLERAPVFGPESIFTPREAALRAERQAKPTAPPVAVESRPTPSPSDKAKAKAPKEPHTKIASGLQKLLGEDVGWSQTGPLKKGFTRDAFNLGKKLKTKKDVERATKAAVAYRQAAKDAIEAATDEAGLMKSQEFTNRAQYFDEAVEYATGNPPKASTFRRHDPNYTPNVPHPEWTKMIEKGLNNPVPKVGETYAHWTEDGFPLDTRVTKMDGDTVHYFESNYVTGETSEKVASLQEYDRLQLHPSERPVVGAANKPIEPPPGDKVRLVDDLGEDLSNPKKPVEPAADARPKVRIKGRFGPEDAVVVGREGNTLHVEIDDPIFGKRTTSVLESDTLPVAGLQPEIPKGGVPFKDVESIHLTGKEGAHGYLRGGEEGNMLGSVMEGHGPAGVRKTIPGSGKEALTIEEGLKKLPKEAAAIIGEIMHRLKVAAGHDIDTSLAMKMVGAKGGMYEQSGRIALNLQWINQVVRNWDKMKPEAQGRALMRVAALFGHEISHVSHKFGERTGLMIDGVPITEAVMKRVDNLTAEQRHYIAAQIKDAKGELGGGVSSYLAGDIDAVYGWYKRHRPNLTREGAKELAAGEVLAEIGAVELVKRMKVEGLPDGFRAAVDKFKQVLVRVVDWFRGKGQHEGVAALQDLSAIASKMHDHFAAGDTAALGKAFPASDAWRPPPKINPFSSGAPTPATIGPSEAAQPFAKMEMGRILGRAVVGGTIGAFAGPAATDHTISTAEGVVIGGIMGAFGPAMAKTILNKQLAKELIEAAKASKGNPIAAMKAIMGGKSLRELGAEGRYGMRGDGSAFAKIVRLLESELDVNLDPKIKAAIEQARGIMGKQFAIVEDALKRARYVKPSQGVKDAALEYIEGRIPKERFLELMPDEASKLYANLMVTAREATSVGTDLLANGLRKSAFRDAIIEAREKYVGRFYKAYRDGEFNMDAYEKVKADFMQMHPELDIHNADALLREHMVEIKANRKLFAGKRGTGEQSIEGTLRFRRRATEEEIYMQQLEVGSLEHNPHSAEYREAKAKLDWMETHKITDNWREWLGEIKDPTERMLYTFQKIYPSSIAAKIYDLFDTGLNSFGNKFAYSADELTKTRGLLQSEIESGRYAGEELAGLQTRLKELEYYTPLPEGAKYGKISGKFTDRFVRDQISTYDTPYQWMDQPVIRGIAAVNNIVKENRTVLNPLTGIRNYLQMPMFMLMARVSPQEIWQARKILKGGDARMLDLMRERHVLGVDYAAQELTKNLGNMVTGYMDADIALRAFQHGRDLAREWYQQPDMLLRAGAFISAQKRMAQRMGKDIYDPAVVDAAVEAMDRVTMNYATVPRAVKAARQLPFVSLFISYTSEITKIIKNLTQDMIGKDTHPQDRLHAMMVLGGMAAIPPMLVGAAEANLSPQDRKDWKKLRQLQPDYARTRFLMPLGREKDGRFRYMDFTNMIPADNYTQMAAGVLKGDFAAAATANPFAGLQDTPLLNIATEQVSGSDLRTGQPVQGFGRVKEIMKEILPPWVPPGYEGTRLARAFSENQEGGWGLTNTRTGVEYRPSDMIANYMTGMRFANVSLAAVQKSAISEAKQRIAEQQQQLRQTIGMNIPDGQKVEARNHYRQVVEEIMLELHRKMETKE